EEPEGVLGHAVDAEPIDLGRFAVDFEDGLLGVPTTVEMAREKMKAVAGGVEFRLVAQVPFADQSGAVAARLQLLGPGRQGGVESKAVFRLSRRDPVGDAVLRAVQ